ncbi:phosphatidylinositol-4-phosphate (PIP) 5-kinase, putative [Theileria annulata]|uniref:Phosphatidylinositol-4-phosphate (PIP) 5-kinase, putative n=1 Tax=Theileria annulata TaxID=5874 RepID=Q4UC13_THEAN|nr:phosphatidylinositol-4-phosphate (PIP) 5-kinase, putative [Theileria annulata]CAI75638.1 phosphatidylinositol-4-phosphate (PIP) 5-kinase, putative [Theileria annulata]|eukprot:XP_955114.1 phosphatidylinositol-4-phosphate (PIP) 5-kinase, putative [Theileria annulata]
MGAFCSKHNANYVSKTNCNTNITTNLTPTHIEDNFVVDKAEYKFVEGGFGTKTPEKWDLDFLATELRTSIKTLEQLSNEGSAELVKLPPILNDDYSVYYGEWKDGKYEGKGQLFMPDGSQYIGSFSNGVFNGIFYINIHLVNCLIWSGEILFLNGDTFKGMFSNGKRRGKGILKFKNGDLFEGLWNNEVRNGYGVERFADGTVFMGNFKNNKRSGRGELAKPDGTKYEGNFNNNEITGYGMMRWLNGESYTGNFRNGIKHGFGTTMWKSGEFVSRKGIYKDGKMCGAFKTVKRDGSVFDALYQDDSLVKMLTEEEMKQYTHKNSDRSDRSSSSRTTNSFNSRRSYKQYSSSNSFNRATTNGLNSANDVNSSKHEPRDINPNNDVNNRNNNNRNNNMNNRNNFTNNRSNVFTNKPYRGRRVQSKFNET